MRTQGRKKCDKCLGKGGRLVVTIVFGEKIETFVECRQCQNKGEWWPNNRPKRERVRA